MLFGISRYVLQKKFADVLASLDLDDCGYTLGSLRAGGATDFFQRTRNLGELQYQGREDGQQPQICNIISWKPFLLCTSREAREKLESVHTLKKLLEHPPKFDAQELYRRVT